MFVTVVDAVVVPADSQELSSSDRQAHAEKIKVALTKIAALDPSAGATGQAIIDMMVTLSYSDKIVSSNEKQVLGEYINVLAPEYSVDQSLAVLEGQMKSMQHKAKRAEVPVNLKGIKTAELMYEADNDVYVSAAAYPANGNGESQQWEEAKSGGFSVLGWMPYGDVRGTYWVTTTATNFTAYGIIDVDGDGQFATYTATKSVNPNAPITGPNVY